MVRPRPLPLIAVLVGFIGWASALTPAHPDQILCGYDAYVLATVMHAKGLDCVPRPPRRCYLTNMDVQLKIDKVIAVRASSVRMSEMPEVGATYAGPARLHLADRDLAYKYYLRPVEDEEMNRVLAGTVHLVGIRHIEAEPQRTFSDAKGERTSDQAAIDDLTERLRLARSPSCPSPAAP